MIKGNEIKKVINDTKKYFILTPPSHNIINPLQAINTEVPKSGCDKTKIIGAEKYALTLKPISKINYSELTNKLENKTIGIIGAGPAGVEVALALKKRFVNSKI